MSREKLLEIINVKQYFEINRNNFIKALDDVSINIYKGEFLGLVGESGSGKSTLGKSIVGVNKLTSGKILYDGIDISIKKNQKKIISENIQFIFQDSTSSLNSRMTIGKIIEEPLKFKKVYRNKEDRVQKVYDMLKLVGIDESYINKYPYDFSGGQRQRVNIARALSTNPSFIIADEPIASLDISMQAQIINLFKSLKEKMNLTCLCISHDLAMLRYISDRIAVIYNGKIVEIAETEELYSNPIHPYTKELITSILTVDINNKFKVDINERSKFIIDNDNSRWIEVKKNHFVYLST
ncbi:MULTISPECIES: ABC transporter ATP-binding protein [unclassified Clostridium]|uniref:ATP-binding cassette domain-containing protein n=1 Tax=unclassified Clostridium TaxID=2614128 RepID=UPI001C8B0C59|nr:MULTISPECIES: ABC transporter ATP-binding protein [unclassified Clostridium]MBX9139201.1 ABC transporter ATP-binding protein [Clostridium sp. K12(2020)]MBX9145965.1 ABC transporter ATP-binding protein [Clostridium sp. K13]